MALETHSILRSLVKLRAVVPDDAFTAAMLGAERIGNGVVIDDTGLVLTIGYLIIEATDVWLTLWDGREIAGHVLAYDQVTGFGLVLPLKKPAVSPLPLGSSAGVRVGGIARVFCHSQFAAELTVHVLARREFAGAWEYLLEDAIFAAPAHPYWSGAALVDDAGTLIGLGSLLIRESIGGEDVDANMFVPIDDLKPILNDLVTRGQAARPGRPWLGIYAVEVDGKVYVSGTAQGGPAQLAGVREGDVIAQIDDRHVASLPAFYRQLWSAGPAGVVVTLVLVRGANKLIFRMRSADRADRLKRPQAH